MKNEKIQNELKELFQPFAYLDFERACEIAEEVGENARWIFEHVEQLREDCLLDANCRNYSDIDIVGTLYQAILEEVKDEIEELTDFDLQNESDIYVAANSIATSYDYKESDITKFKEVLKKIDIAKLSTKAQWFLNQLNY